MVNWYKTLKFAFNLSGFWMDLNGEIHNSQDRVNHNTVGIKLLRDYNSKNPKNNQYNPDVMSSLINYNYISVDKNCGNSICEFGVKANKLNESQKKSLLDNAKLFESSNKGKDIKYSISFVGGNFKNLNFSKFREILVDH